MKCQSVGPSPAKILIVGEAPGKTEEEQGVPFVGESGKELTKMLNEAGILRTEVRLTNVVKYRPPDNDMDNWWSDKKKGPHGFINIDGNWFDPRVVEGLSELEQEIDASKPNIIIPLGNLPLWALTRNTGITKWRGSLLRHQGVASGPLVIPTIHPAAVLRKWDWRWLVVQDLRRAKAWQEGNYVGPNYDFISGPSFDQVRHTLQGLLSRLSSGELVRLGVDIETERRLLACIGLAWSSTAAICMPFIRHTNTGSEPYWTLEEETEIVVLLRTILTHRNAQCCGQNWGYDYQYVAKSWGFEVNLWMDIMTEHHLHFPGLPKGLDFQSSLYRPHHVYWKDEGKERGKGDDTTWWRYNCMDCVATLEIAEHLIRQREAQNYSPTEYGTAYEIQQKLGPVMWRASMRGVRKDHTLAGKMAFMLQEDIAEGEAWINRVVGHPLNVRSPQQMHKYFYEDLGLRKILDRKTGRPTLNSEALDKIEKRDILLRPICQAVKHVRSLSNSLSVCLQPTDTDGRLRCQYIIPGTETFRFASHSDPFGYGGNLQNITSGDEEESSEWPLPNIRKVFLPDPGFMLGEFDLPQADARVVAWEAEDESLIELFLDPTRHLHQENAELLYGHKVTSKTYPLKYYYAKQGVHLTNYGGSAQVLAMTLGITVHEAEQFQRRWFGAHPKILQWHNRVRLQLQLKREVWNKFGYSRFYFDRIDDTLKEALAWIPQSTVGNATNIGILNVNADQELKSWGVELLMQVHDSAIFQWPKWRHNQILPRMLNHMRVVVPYAPIPLVFKPGAKLSDKSWGEVEEAKEVA